MPNELIRRKPAGGAGRSSRTTSRSTSRPASGPSASQACKESCVRDNMSVSEIAKAAGLSGAGSAIVAGRGSATPFRASGAVGTAASIATAVGMFGSQVDKTYQCVVECEKKEEAKAPSKSKDPEKPTSSSSRKKSGGGRGASINTILREAKSLGTAAEVMSLIRIFR